MSLDLAPVRPRSKPAVIRLLLADGAVGCRRGTDRVGGRHRAIAVAWKSLPRRGSHHRTVEADTVEQMQEGRGLHACAAPHRRSQGLPPCWHLHELDAAPW
jgi:hypothetical protein